MAAVAGAEGAAAVAGFWGDVFFFGGGAACFGEAVVVGGLAEAAVELAEDGAVAEGDASALRTTVGSLEGSW